MNLLIQQRLHAATLVLQLAQQETRTAQQNALLQSVCLLLWHTLQCMCATIEQNISQPRTNQQKALTSLNIQQWRENKSHPYSDVFALPWVQQLDMLYQQLCETQQGATLATTALVATPQVLDAILRAFKQSVATITERQYEC